MADKQRFTAEQVCEALRETKGMVYLAAKRLGVTGATVYNYRDRYASVRAVIEEQSGEVDDVAEMTLYKAIVAGEPWAIQFRLRTKGKTRGYTERTEVTGADGGAITVVIDR